MTEAKSVGHDTKTVTSATAVGLPSATGSIPTNAQSADVHTSLAIHALTDGGTPTSGVGMPYAAGAKFTLESRSEILGFKAIADGASSTLQVIYYDLPARGR
jgi:hypothetical protein